MTVLDGTAGHVDRSGITDGDHTGLAADEGTACHVEFHLVGLLGRILLHVNSQLGGSRGIQGTAVHPENGADISHFAVEVHGAAGCTGLDGGAVVQLDLTAVATGCRHVGGGFRVHLAVSTAVQRNGAVGHTGVDLEGSAFLCAGLTALDDAVAHNIEAADSALQRHIATVNELLAVQVQAAAVTSGTCCADQRTCGTGSIHILSQVVVVVFGQGLACGYGSRRQRIPGNRLATNRADGHMVTAVGGEGHGLCCLTGGLIRQAYCTDRQACRTHQQHQRQKNG